MMLRSKTTIFLEKCSFATCFLKKPVQELIPCPHCQKAKYCCQKCLILDWEAWHKFSCPDSLSNNGSMRSNTKSPLLSKKFDDYEVLDVDFLSKKNKSVPFEERYQEKYQIVEKAKFQSETLKEQMLKSFRTHQRTLIHPHIIRLFHFFEDQTNFYLVHEFLDRNLNSLFIKRKKLIEREAFLFFSQIALALDFLHKKSILHKSLNFTTTLLDQQGNVKLSEFGKMVDFSDPNTLGFISPETLKNKLFTPQNDIWSLGLILYEMIHGHKAFRNGELKLASYVSDECLDLIIRMLAHNPEERISLENVLSHSWIKKYEDVYKIKLKGYIHQESQEERLSEGAVRTFIPSFTANRFSKRGSMALENVRPNFLSVYHHTISFADEEGVNEEEEEKSPIIIGKPYNSRVSKGRENKEVENLIKKKKDRQQKVSEHIATKNMAENAEENEKRSTNIDSNVHDLFTLSEKEVGKTKNEKVFQNIYFFEAVLKEISGFWGELLHFLNFGCFCLSKTKEKESKSLF